MVSRGVMLGVTIDSKVVPASIPINVELILCYPILEPIKPNINGFGMALVHSGLDDTIHSVVISLEWGWWLWEWHSALSKDARCGTHETVNPPDIMQKCNMIVINE